MAFSDGLPRTITQSRELLVIEVVRTKVDKGDVCVPWHIQSINKGMYYDSSQGVCNIIFFCCVLRAFYNMRCVWRKFQGNFRRSTRLLRTPLTVAISKMDFQKVFKICLTFNFKIRFITD